MFLIQNSSCLYRNETRTYIFLVSRRRVHGRAPLKIRKSLQERTRTFLAFTTLTNVCHISTRIYYMNTRFKVCSWEARMLATYPRHKISLYIYINECYTHWIMTKHTGRNSHRSVLSLTRRRIFIRSPFWFVCTNERGPSS